MSDTTKPERVSDIKIILLGDSAVGKSKLVERFLLDDFHPQTVSTYALTLYKHICPNPLSPDKNIQIELWDTAGQERFENLHASYYHNSHVAILCFDVSRKITYKNLDKWYESLVKHRGVGMPVLLVANKIDLDPSRARKKYAFVEERLKERNGDFPVFFCSASDGTNVVKAFEESIKRAMMFQTKGDKEDLSNEVLRFIHEESIREGGMFNNDREQSELDFE